MQNFLYSGNIILVCFDDNNLKAVSESLFVINVHNVSVNICV